MDVVCHQCATSLSKLSLMHGDVCIKKLPNSCVELAVHSGDAQIHGRGYRKDHSTDNGHIKVRLRKWSTIWCKQKTHEVPLTYSELSSQAYI